MYFKDFLFILICGNDMSNELLQSREGSSIADDWDARPHTIEEVKAMLQHKKEAAMKREKTLSRAFSQQVHHHFLPISHLHLFLLCSICYYMG